MTAQSSNIRICYFPGRETSYVRNRVLVKGLKEAGFSVYDCSYPKRKNIRYVIAFFRFLKYKNKCDIIFIGFFGQFLVLLARMFTRKKIVFDTFLSAYQTVCFDRKNTEPASLKAKLIRFIEKKSCELSNLNLLDTNQHINYFVKEYGLKPERFLRSFLGADDSFSPEVIEKSNQTNNPFLVHFHGEFQALHGTEYIIRAASLCKNIPFRLIGSGKELDSCKRLADQLQADNIEFIPFVPFDQIPEYIAQSSLCLGIFGDTEKTQIVIPFKVYEAMAMGKPIITAETPAVRELLTHKHDVYFCQPANPQSLAKAIQTLHADRNMRESIGHNALATFKNKCSPKVIGEALREPIEKLLN